MRDYHRPEGLQTACKQTLPGDGFVVFGWRASVFSCVEGVRDLVKAFLQPQRLYLQAGDVFCWILGSHRGILEGNEHSVYRTEHSKETEHTIYSSHIKGEK